MTKSNIMGITIFLVLFLFLLNRWSLAAVDCQPNDPSHGCYYMTNQQACYNGTLTRLDDVDCGVGGKGYSANFRFRSVIHNNTDLPAILKIRLAASYPVFEYDYYDRVPNYTVAANSTASVDYTVTITKACEVSTYLIDTEYTEGMLVVDGYDWGTLSSLSPCSGAATPTPTPRPTATSTPRPTATSTPIPTSTPTSGPTPTPDCTTYYWQVEADNGSRTNLSVVRDFQVCEGGVAWFQTKEGDIHAGGEIKSSIPLTATNRNFSYNDSGDYPGIITYGTTASFSSGYPSASTADHWLVKTIGFRKYYDYFYSLLDSPTLSSPPPTGDIPEGTVDGIIAYDGNISVPSSGWDISNRKAVVLTTGKLLVKGRITIDVAGGGSLVVIAKDSIGIDKNLVANGTGGSRFRGIFLTDETFYSSIEPDFSFSPVESDKQLVIDGQVVAQTFNFGRDLGGGAGGNETTAAENFRYDPGLVMNSHQDIWNIPHVWKELTP